MTKTAYHLLQYRQHPVWRVGDEYEVGMRCVFRLGIKDYIAPIELPASHVSDSREHHGHELEIFSTLTPSARMRLLKVCPPFSILPNIVRNGAQSPRELGFPAGRGILWRTDGPSF
jgi:hypothetical protein